MLTKTTLRKIRKSLGRYIAILAIVALGAGFFSGLKIARTDMVSTASEYLNNNHFYDYSLISTLGFTDSDVDSVSNLSYVDAAEGSISTDILYVGYKSIDTVAKMISIPNRVNTVEITTGRAPRSNDECLLDAQAFSDDYIGTKIRLSQNNEEDDLSKFTYDEYTVVGLCKSPLFLNFERGSSAIGNGFVSCYIYIPQNGFNVDYYTEINVRTKTDADIYSSSYKDYINKYKGDIETVCSNLANKRYNDIISEASKELSAAASEYEENYNSFLSARSSTYQKLCDAYYQITEGENTLKQQLTTLNENKALLTTSISQLNLGIADVNSRIDQLEASRIYMTQEEYDAAYSQLSQSKQSLLTQKSTAESNLLSVSEGINQIQSAQNTLSLKKQDYFKSKQQAEEKFAEAEKTLQAASAQIDSESKKLTQISLPKTYVLTRDSNVGYVSFDNDSSIVDGIAKVFPVFFFLVAALVCMTTMTRMVDEQRTQIGVFKALGYSNISILGEYLFYAGSSAATGAILGFFGGCFLFPMVIWRAYGMMYAFDPTLNYIFDWRLGSLSLVAALVCSMGATLISCINDFRVVPAELIRQKSPKSGKRILIERIPPLWKKISFLHKVTLRNIFRYKKRFFMMILGISGCTALLLTGFGVNDSVKNIVNFQYDEIMTYDYSIIFDSAMSESKQNEFTEISKPYVSGITYLHEGNTDFIKGNDVKSSSLIVSDSDSIRSFVDLHTKSGKIDYPGYMEAVICKKMAQEYKVNIGDTIKLRDSSGNVMEVKVSSICENYIYDYIYVSPETCLNGWGYIPEFKTAYVKTQSNDAGDIKTSAKNISSLPGVTATSVNNDMRDRVNQMMTSLDAVIGVVIMSAAALAFIVLYNLTNINITERVREIATIKVLGFYPRETSAYVFRENFVLTTIGALVGLAMGKLLHSFVMNQLKIDLIYFDIRIKVISYILAVLLTFAFAITVSFVMYFKLNRISMIDSLKANE